MERVTGVDYTAPDGTTIATRYDNGVWIITDSTGRHEFTVVRAWLDYIRETYGWPLPSVIVD